MFAHREVRDGVGFAVSDRHGGFSRPRYDALNLADHVGDDPAAVAENRQRVAAALGAGPLVTMRQVHGRRVAVVDAVPAQPPEADALVTADPGQVLVVLVADCTPVLLADPVARVVAVVHAGRRGLAAGVLPAAVDAMGRAGARPHRVWAVLGPSICAGHYEVPAAMRDEVDAAAPGAAATSAAGTPALDIRAGLRRQLTDAGLPARSVQTLDVCTAESAAFYSHRRDGVTGRFAGFAWLA